MWKITFNSWSNHTQANTAYPTCFQIPMGPPEPYKDYDERKFEQYLTNTLQSEPKIQEKKSGDIQSGAFGIVGFYGVK